MLESLCLNYDFVNYFLILIGVRPRLVPGAVEANNHSPRPLQVHNLVEKMEYQSTAPLQCRESCKGETWGCEDSVWGVGG